MTHFFENPVFTRLSFSLGGLVTFWILGRLFPYRKSPEFQNWKRTLTNLGITFGNGILISRIVTPGFLMALTYLPEVQRMALPSFPIGSDWLQIVFGVILLDLVIYWQHRLTHKIPTLWKLHRVHHTDIEFDTTTAGRFHTLEIIMSFFIRAFFIILFAIPASAVLAFEVILNFSALFNHSNFSLPSSLEKQVRKIIITPDLHRIHHSTLGKEMNSNYGFSTSLWDRLFKSLTENSKGNPQTMAIGLKTFRSQKDQSFLGLLLQPFSKSK